jgi:hypothetical protein
VSQFKERPLSGIQFSDLSAPGPLSAIGRCKQCRTSVSTQCYPARGPNMMMAMPSRLTLAPIQSVGVS